MKTYLYLGFSSMLMIFLFGCKKVEENAKVVTAPTYKIFKAKTSNTTLLKEYPVKLEGITDIEIRSKVDGYIEKIYVEEGEIVKKGQTLFQLETQITSQEAAIAKANLEAAQLEVNRLTPLVERNIISQVNLDTAKAKLAAVKSSYQSILAKINYATIKSPSNGVIGDLPLKIGSYVSMQTAQPLTIISDISTINAYFSINEKEQLELVMESEGNTFEDKISKIPPVQLMLSNGMIYNEKGIIKTISGQANVQTGSFRVKASFPNPNRLLRSGETGIIQIPTYIKEAILIPQTATFELQDKRMALILDADNHVKNVPIEVRPVPGGQYFVVDEGLNIDDKILIEGVGLISEGTKINPIIVDYDQVIISKK